MSNASKLAVVTGGIRGIGRAIAQALHSSGYLVIANYKQNTQLAEKFSQETGISAIAWNVANIEECNNAINDIEQKYNMPVSILVNNAGITDDYMLHKMEAHHWHNVLDANLSSCFNMSHCVINNMRQQKFGRIINISSINAQTGQLGQTNYSAAKAGIIGFSKALAKESAPKNITVNCIAPGYIETDMTKQMPDTVREQIVQNIPVGKFGSVGDIARAVIFLVADESDFITGATLSINGGHNMA